MKACITVIPAAAVSSCSVAVGCLERHGSRSRRAGKHSNCRSARRSVPRTGSARTTDTDAIVDADAHPSTAGAARRPLS